MYFKCSVPGCVSSRQDAILHKFPKCVKRLQKWLDSINCESLRQKGDFGSLQVCHKHFEPRFVTQKSRLLATAYPTLFLETEILSGIPLNPTETAAPDHTLEHQYAKKMHSDHSYCKSHFDEMQKSTDVFPSTSTDGLLKDINDPVIQKQLPSDPKIIQKLKHTKRTVAKVEALTPKCRKLYNEFRKSRKLLSFTRRERLVGSLEKYKILKGTDIIRLETRCNLPGMQMKALCKYKKKLKRKNK